MKAELMTARHAWPPEILKPSVHCQADVDTSKVETSEDSLQEPGRRGLHMLPSLTFHASKRFQEDVIFVDMHIHFLMNVM